MLYNIFADGQGVCGGMCTGTCLHTMAILQAYLDKGEGVGPDAIKELRRSTDLFLRATKETALS